ncbi:MAG: glycerophosphodiester phosphodiesterase [Spirochaetales bacterium]|nr:glycerophosphodiester phosphodiesterase [Spirochaetales bacterium]
MHSKFFEKRLKVVAHRGDSAFFPENTLPAFMSAAGLKVDCIETDVHLTKDGVCVIWHDDSMERTTGDRGLISEKKYSDILSMDAGYMFSGDNGKTYPFRGKGITIATLDELLKSIPEMRFNIDLKDNNRKLVDEFTRVVRANKAENRVLGASFHDSMIKALRNQIPEIATSFSKSELKKIVYMDKLKILRLHREFQAEAAQIPEYSGSLKVLTNSLIRTLHSRGVYVHVWTINNCEDMKRLFGMGVDTIMTDNPRLLIETVESLEIKTDFF